MFKCSLTVANQYPETHKHVISWHDDSMTLTCQKDDAQEEQEHMVVVSVSRGASQPFLLRPKVLAGNRGAWLQGVWCPGRRPVHKQKGV